jgi:hypothetical protein
MGPTPHVSAGPPCYDRRRRTPLAANIKRALEAELYFYGKVLGFEPADKLAPIPISNCCNKRR